MRGSFTITGIALDKAITDFVIIHVMEPAKTVIDKLGGAQAVADFLGVSPVRVYCWTYPRTRGGTGGLIPAKHQAKLLQMADRLGIRLRAADLIQEAA